MSRLDPAPVDQATKEGKPTRWEIYAGALAACIAIGALLIALPLHRSNALSVTTSVPAVQVEDNLKFNATASAEIELRSRLEASEHKITELEQQRNFVDPRHRWRAGESITET
jgi:7-keto-8-aminopelargonate synthetase-like enzyme